MKNRGCFGEYSFSADFFLLLLPLLNGQYNEHIKIKIYFVYLDNRWCRRHIQCALNSQLFLVLNKKKKTKRENR